MKISRSVEGNGCTYLFILKTVSKIRVALLINGPVKKLHLSYVTGVIYPGSTPINEGHLLRDETAVEFLWIYCIESEQILFSSQ